MSRKHINLRFQHWLKWAKLGSTNYRAKYTPACLFVKRAEKNELMFDESNLLP